MQLTLADKNPNTSALGPEATKQLRQLMRKIKTKQVSSHLKGASLATA
jgi:hypothetical protein